MGLISLCGYVVLGLPGFLFLSLSGLNKKPWNTAVVGALLGLLFLFGYLAASGFPSWPPLGLLGFAALHGVVTGFSFSIISNWLFKARGIDWFGTQKDGYF